MNHIDQDQADGSGFRIDKFIQDRMLQVYGSTLVCCPIFHYKVLSLIFKLIKEDRSAVVQIFHNSVDIK